MDTVGGIHKDWLLSASSNVKALKALASEKFLFVATKVWATSEVNATATTLTKNLSEWKNTR